jgi:Na+/phosphate symporter
LTEDIFIQPGQTLTLAPVIISSIAPTLIAGIVFFLFEKYTNNGFRIFSIVAIVLGLLSLMSPFTQIKDVTVGFGVVLDIMHVVVVAALLYFLKAAVDSVRR